MLEELTQALGLLNDSPFDRESIFYSGQSQVARLSEWDRRLLRFAYIHLQPGMDEPTVERLLRRYFWE